MCCVCRIQHLATWFHHETFMSCMKKRFGFIESIHRHKQTLLFEKGECAPVTSFKESPGPNLARDIEPHWLLLRLPLCTPEGRETQIGKQINSEIENFGAAVTITLIAMVSNGPSSFSPLPPPLAAWAPLDHQPGPTSQPALAWLLPGPSPLQSCGGSNRGTTPHPPTRATACLPQSLAPCMHSTGGACQVQAHGPL